MNPDNAEQRMSVADAYLSGAGVERSHRLPRAIALAPWITSGAAILLLCLTHVPAPHTAAGTWPSINLGFIAFVMLDLLAHYTVGIAGVVSGLIGTMTKSLPAAERRKALVVALASTAGLGLIPLFKYLGIWGM